MSSASNFNNATTYNMELQRACCETPASTILQSCDTQSTSSYNESIVEIKKTPKKRRASDEHAFQKLRNYQVYQQAIFIALLNQFFELLVKAPVKRSVVSLQLLRIESIKYLSDIIGVNDFVMARCKEKYKKDISSGIGEKTAKRRSDTNRVTELLHLLQDLLREKGFAFHSKFTDGKNGAQIIETVCSIQGPDGFFISQQEIIHKGALISKYLTDKLVSSSEITLPKEDMMLRNILKNILIKKI